MNDTAIHLFFSYFLIFFLFSTIVFAYFEVRKKVKIIVLLEAELKAEKKKVAELEFQISNPSKFQIGEIVCGYSINSKRYRKLDYRAALFIFGLSKVRQILCKDKKKNEQVEKATNEFLKAEWVYEVEKDGLKGFKTEIELQEIINQNK